ncbi:ribosomal protein L26/L24P, eukaryotic/archaeal [Kipferlia bialata]|uniref:Ribosomal protein L26/L24P, eukaryotic/archaeal n=1 Tax=Kipferlia bialata TaxID=797122 RepID=A0A9K3D7Y0_9EUKA|nr:ribosomal protein L26/L24P, eukaryotic/archaeal [Kipferlia bialata]|eukprot:g12343.t1
MKYSNSVTSDRRKNRKAHFTAPSHVRRVIMSAPLSKDLKEKHGVNAVPIRKGDEVIVVRGLIKKQTKAPVEVVKVYRKKYCVYLKDISRQRNRAGQPTSEVFLPVHPSNLVITKLYMNGDRAKMLALKGKKQE